MILIPMLHFKDVLKTVLYDQPNEREQVDVPNMIYYSGTACSYMVEKFGMVHLSAGDLLRAERELLIKLGLVRTLKIYIDVNEHHS